MRDLDTFSKACNHDPVTLAMLLSLRSLVKIPLEFLPCVSLLVIMIPVEDATAAFKSVGLQNQAKWCFLRAHTEQKCGLTSDGIRFMRTSVFVPLPC